ncbi:hypothetical protein GMRT_11071 [Giardia muris]|uniref:Uncharacterized protein n=1 Tax=Giardia muris TaxID=5742 RepID=A0A4Z1T398_GIAMU|nr:hypothetical protein GMRT_11071 [Giardia muris]|eukprot:TNJ30128.1 hypothetical protein GMRT_11071 [Giardia muris]
MKQIPVSVLSDFHDSGVEMPELSEPISIATYHPDPSALEGTIMGMQALRLDERLLTDFNCAFRIMVIALNSFSQPLVYPGGPSKKPAIIIPLSSTSAYVGFARPEALTMIFSTYNDPVQAELRKLLGEESYDSFVEELCAFTEAGYDDKAYQKPLEVLTEHMKRLLRVLGEKIETIEQTIVPRLLEAIRALKRPLYTFEKVALDLGTAAALLLPFINTLGVSPGSPLLIAPDTFVWLGPGAYWLLTPSDTEDWPTLSPFTVSFGDMLKLLDTCLPLSLYLPRHYCYNRGDVSGELCYCRLDMDIYEFSTATGKQDFISDVSLFDRYELIIRTGEKITYKCLLVIIPVGMRSYTASMGALNFVEKSPVLLTLLSGIYSVSDVRVTAPAYQLLTEYREDDTLSAIPLGLSVMGNLSGILVTQIQAYRGEEH